MYNLIPAYPQYKNYLSESNISVAEKIFVVNLNSCKLVNNCIDIGVCIVWRNKWTIINRNTIDTMTNNLKSVYLYLISNSKFLPKTYMLYTFLFMRVALLLLLKFNFRSKDVMILLYFSNLYICVLWYTCVKTVV